LSGSLTTPAARFNSASIARRCNMAEALKHRLKDKGGESDILKHMV
jgi:hypothetical protein